MKKDFFLALLLFFLSGLTFYETSKFPKLTNLQVVDAAFVPRLIAIFLVISAMYLLYTSFKSKEGNLTINLKNRNLWRVVVIISLLIIYVIFLPLIGFEIATILFLSVSMLVCNLKNWIKIISTSLVVIVFVYFVFIYALRVPLPLKFL